MRDNIGKVTGWVKAHPVATTVLVALFAPGFIFGFVFQVIGFIGWGRVILALLLLGGWCAYRFVKSQLDGYKATADDVVSFAREVKDEWYK